jgi:outer membrane protein OmpA-like peptidoglycan-associated protein
MRGEFEKAVFEDSARRGLTPARSDPGRGQYIREGSMKLMRRSVVVLALILLGASVGSASGSEGRDAKGSSPNTTASAPAVKSTKSRAKTRTRKAARRARNSRATPKSSTAQSRPPGKSSFESEAPKFVPVPATSGALGLFTVESGETLPRGSVSVAGYVNKFSRNPGSVSILNLGYTLGYAFTDRLTVMVGWEPYRHTHIGNPSELSLRSPLNNPQFGSTIYRRLGPGLNPGYVEDFPFANSNSHGIGDLALGLKFGLLSEKKGNPFSLAVENIFYIPTRSQLRDLLNTGVQSGAFNDQIGMSISKTIGNKVMLAGDAGYRFTTDPRSLGAVTMNQADQVRLGGGMLIAPESRVQFMMEYTGTIFRGTATPNTTFGSRNPIDGVWGVRLYPFGNMALDVGYRYMLNLSDVHDRHGFVIKVAGASWREKAAPPPPNRPPVAACSAQPGMVYAGSGDVVSVRAQASDPDGDPLGYTWSASGGSVDGTGSDVRWNSAGLAPGTYTVTARVDDGKGGTASCSADVRVEVKPNRPPVLSCSADRSTVLVGERVKIAGQGSDPDGDPLSYTWRTSGGQVVGSGANVELDTSGVAPGRYTVTGRAEDGRGGAADCSVGVEVQAPPPPPQASKINECLFTKGESARVDNVCKRILDDVALRLKNEPRATVVLVGYADPKERKAEALAGKRGGNVKEYIASKGVDATRMTVRTAGGQKGADKQNRRVDVIWVPEGATY